MTYHPTISSQEYRDAMSHFAGAVHIVTSDGEAGLRGLTVTAAVSASDNPPTVMVCVMRGHVDNQLIGRNGCFALNTLKQDHEELARAFAGEGQLEPHERFAKGNWDQLVTGAPVLKDAHVSLDCRVIEVKPVATHDVIFGEVVASRIGARGNPLLYLERQYRQL